MYCLACIKGLKFSTSPTTDGKVHCPGCRHVPGRGHIRALLEEPDKVKKIQLDKMIKKLWEGHEYLWIYEGRNNGWWYYDTDIQESLSNTDHTLELLICGQRVVIDVVNLLQRNRDTGARRNIIKIHKSEMGDYLIKGIAGMK